MGMGFAPTWLRQVSPLLHMTTLTTGLFLRLDPSFRPLSRRVDGSSGRNPTRTKAFFDLMERKISFSWTFVLMGFRSGGPLTCYAVM